MKYLTKSRFKLAIECPKKLLYTTNTDYKNTKNDDGFLKSLADGGFQVGELAKKLYPFGIEIKEKNSEKALIETAKELEKDHVVLFEPAIAYNNLLVRIDILVKRGDVFELIEVKAKSIDSKNDQFVTTKGDKNTIKSPIKPYVEDVAFQTYVLKNAFPQARVTSYLLMPDKSEVATIDQMNQFFKVKRVGNNVETIANNPPQSISHKDSLLYPLNVDHLIQIVHETGIDYPGGHGSLSELAKEWAFAYENDIPLEVPIGAHCASCEFKAPIGDEKKSGFHECWKSANQWTDAEFDKPLSIELWNFKGKKNFFKSIPPKLHLADVTLDDIKFQPADEGLSNSERQWFQISGLPKEHLSAGYYLDKDFLEREVSNWKYPLHFIDFETSTVAMPFHKGMRPYESVAFQFSHHILEKDGTLRHANQFLLAKPGVFPNYEFARALKNALSSDDGSVFMWATHENTILNHISTQLRTRSDAPSDKEELLAFMQTLIKEGERAMVDLRVLSQKAYFHPSTKGANSIKKVLPAVLMSSSFLKSKYSQPIYGAKDGIPSLNYENFTWWTLDADGKVEEPYKKLLSKESVAPVEDVDPDSLEVAEGGAAATAYGRLQYESLAPDTRLSIEKSLYKYCELDTLAMAMIVEAWMADLKTAKA